MNNQNFTLEIINGVVAINTFFFLVWGLVHLKREFKRRKLTWWFALVGLPSVAIVASMIGEKFGSLITRAVVLNWRMRGGDGIFTEIENWSLCLGALLTACGLLWSVAILSRPRFGEWPWRIAAGVTICYVVVTTLYHFL